jgi:hypothetical protein
MKTSIFIILGVAGIVLLTSATLFKVYSQMRGQPRLPLAPDPRSPTPTSSKALIQGRIYQDLVADHSKRDNGQFYGAFFLEPPFEDATYLNAQFTNCVPRVELGTNNVLLTHGRLVDKLTKKPAAVFWSRTPAITNDVAEVIAGWSMGPEAGQLIRYTLTLTNGTWIIINRRVERVS